MPTSDFHNIGPILQIAGRIAPLRVLDIGCGFGKYGVLLREYLDVARGRLQPADWQTEIVGIEVYEPYRNPIYSWVYNETHFGNALEVLPRLGQFDLVIMCDVIEHLTIEQARALVQTALVHADFLVISTPREFSPQGAWGGNVHETHRCVFTASDFPAATHVHVTGAVDCLIFTASRQPLPRDLFCLTEPADHLYVRMRYHLGLIGAPVALTMRGLNRLLGRR